jgi:hypothetical protein
MSYTELEAGYKGLLENFYSACCSAGAFYPPRHRVRHHFNFIPSLLY